jgi:Fe-S-cluster-containing dehydrogenase component
MSHLVSFQSVGSLTSLNSDDNYPIKPSQQLPLILNILHELSVSHKASISRSMAALMSQYANVHQSFMDHDSFKALVGELWENRGQSIVVAGGLPTKTKDSLALQIATNYLNNVLENDGTTIHWATGIKGQEQYDSDLTELIADMKEGKVKTLVINELNPIYSLPAQSEFKSALAEVENLIVTNNWMDETASLADLVAPAGHYMENWGDNEFVSGLITIQQPTIQPLHDTRSFADSLIVWANKLDKSITSHDNFYAHLKDGWQKQLGSESAWYDLLQKGFRGDLFEGTERNMGFNPTALNQVKVSLTQSEIELVLYEKSAIHDGTMTNLSWLQELPDPVSKIVWDNYLMVSPSLANQLKLRDGSKVKVKSQQHEMELPVYISPGQHPQTVAVAIGYGRQAGGELHKDVGFNVNEFITQEGDNFLFSGFSVELKKRPGLYPLAQTQGHHNMEGRDIAIETTQKNYIKTNDIGLHRHKMFSLWSGHKYDGHKWAMGVDLNACTGCSACMVACQSENNIPSVGKKYVLGGREMHWIRIDRYYSGNEEKSVDAIFQPVMCQHCENAPCETVCPVLATVHSDEGLNDMVYNRCVGTRYCSNNCPYKVRRFNWFYYDGHHRKEPLHMALNPEVTVRTRGVMEKCTFCVQRIKEAKNIAKDENRPLKDGDVRTACQSVCPTEAIVFGDLNDKSSQVSQWFDSQRQYTLLEEFHAAPRVRYLAKIRNTQRDLGGGHHDHSHSESDSHGGGHS